ncbi:AMP-binding protein [Gallaecimonas sp. GXIMD4217]|uniref:AMP-binding protein n=1 Tax=Gallaecimonas sp. GXIMD4217 TaxID=3131927 RepID=UPI00311AF755
MTDFNGLPALLQGAGPIALDEDGRHWQGPELLASASALSGQLRAGQSWLLSAAHPLHFASGLLACWFAGAVPVLPPNGQGGTLNALLADCQGLIGDAVEGFSGRRLAPWCQGGLVAELPRLSGGELVLYTSGSTGEPKAIRKRLGQLAAEVAALEACFGQQLGDALVLSTVSHQHIYGLLFRLLWPLCAGRMLHCQQHAYPEHLAAAARGREVVLISSPAHLERLPEAAVMAPLAEGLRAVFSSGGPLSLEGARQAAAKLGQAPVEVLGSSETGGVAWRRQAISELWQPLPGVQAQAAQDGTLVVVSPFAGGEPQAMGDRVAFEADGRFRLLGRKDRIVKLEQKRLSLDAMERQLMSHPLVERAALVLLAGQRQQLGAVLVLTPKGRDWLAGHGRRALGLLLREALAGHYDRVVLPRKWRVLAEMPVNSQGKTTQASLKALFEQ